MQILHLLFCLGSERESAFLTESKLIERMTFGTNYTSSRAATFGAIGSVALKRCAAKRANVMLHVFAAVLAVVGSLGKCRTANRTHG